MAQSKSTKHLLILVYTLATVQFAWCYLWLTRPYVNTLLYERGAERMPFQGRLLMAIPLRWANHSAALHALSQPFALSRFWFPRPVAPEVLVQAFINVLCLATAGYFTTRIYQASSSRRLLTPLVYPLLLGACAATYMLHTVQNFRFVYDLPSLAFFSIAMYLLYFRRHWSLFAALFLVATLNRETTLLLLPLYLLNEAAPPRSPSPHANLHPDWPRVLRPQPLFLTATLGLLWTAWQIFLRHRFAHNPSEFYPRINWNVKSILVPQAWPQLLSACGYLLLFVVAFRRRIADPQLRTWLFLIPIWLLFMFVYGILIETRVFGELIPLLVAASTLILEDMILARIAATQLHATRVEALPPTTAEPHPIDVGQAA